MKDYEIIAELERKIRWARHKVDTWTSRLGHIQSEYKKTVDLHNRMNEALLAEVKDYEQTLADLEVLYEEAKQELEDFLASKEPEPPKKEENGKIICDLCGEEFAPQGYPAHRRKCEKIHQLQEELAELEGE